MQHFIVLSWHAADPAAAVNAARIRETLARRAWNLIVDSHTISVFAQKDSSDPGMRTYTLHNSSGVIFGRLFRISSSNNTADPTALDIAGVIRSKGRKLLEEYWGSYVAVLYSEKEQTTFVIRDCSGRIPCYCISTAGLNVLFSDIADVGNLGIRFTLNPKYLAAYILHFPLHIRDTGLSEVSEVLAGDCVELSKAGVTHHSVWNPRSIAETQILDDYGQAEAELRSVTEQVIRLWSSTYNRILLKLSGGLDSAIVLGCLARLKCADRIVCVNHYTPDTEDDERPYARAAADLAGVPLVELPRVCDPRVFVEKLQHIPPDPCPDVPKTMKMLSLDQMNDLAQHFNCDTVWTGQGGDHIYLQLRNSYPAVDYLLQHAIPWKFPSMLYHSAVLAGRSLWSVLGEAAHYWWRRDSNPPDPFRSSGASLMTESAVSSIDVAYIAAAWHFGRGKLPPGKLTQIDIYSDLVNRHKPFSTLERPQECHPLISQPLLDLSLRIPTYHLLRGGRQRAMARAAFADRVPQCILTREDKGGIIDQTRSLLRGSGALLREALLDGTLVQLEILDRAALERIIVSQDTYRASQVYALLACIAVETWAQHWTARTALSCLE